MPAAKSATEPQYGERSEESGPFPSESALRGAQLRNLEAQTESVEKHNALLGTKNGLVAIISVVILVSAVPVNVFLWHLALTGR